MTSISLLAITNRPKHADWLMWNLGRLEAALSCDVETYVVQDFHAEKTVGEMRNHAMAHSSGEWIAWIDDDDWYHPNRFETMLRDVSGTSWFAHSHCWMWDVRRGMVGKRLVKKPINGCAIYRRAHAITVPYDESAKPASDVRWLSKFSRQFPGVLALDTGYHTLLGLHGSNFGNKTDPQGCRVPLARVEAAVGAEAWGDTTAQIEAFRAIVCP